MARRLGIIGGGNMGQAIARGAITAHVLRPDEIMVAELDPGKRAELDKLGCPTSDDAC
ncbi:MAG: NAD(P)-binding domain-containing protein, partial [Planctomycetota bacterium]